MDEYEPNVDHNMGNIKKFKNSNFFWRPRSGAERRKRKREILRAKGVINVNAVLERGVPPRMATNGGQNDSSCNTMHERDVPLGVKRAGPYSNWVKASAAPITDEKPLRLLIVPQDYPDTTITTEQMELLRDVLGVLIDGLAFDKAVPKMHTVWNEGYVVALCKDQETISWLTSVIPECKPWKEAALKTTSGEDLPARVNLWVPGPKIENNTIFSRIQKQNDGIMTSSWQVLGRAEDADGVSLELAIPKASSKKVMELNKRLYCGAVIAVAYFPGKKPTDLKSFSV